jgi:hypothetical protein
MILIHKYISKGDRKSRASAKAPRAAAIGRALAHMKYIQHRPGLDREEGGRKFFDETEAELDAKELRTLVKEANDGHVTVHMLTLSPEINLADKRALTIEVMNHLGAEKGQDLRWFAVEHNNTDHFHVHVVILGKDKAGKDVFIKKADHKEMRECGDAYLERWHPIEMAYAKEEREKRKAERIREAEIARELARQERIKEGLELPWLHKKIIREQIEPYDQWKRTQKQKQLAKREEKARKERERAELSSGDKSKLDDVIRADGRYWSKDNTLKELTDLNEYLWEDRSHWISRKSYDRLVGWIREKEQEERTGKKRNGKGKDDAAAIAEKDKDNDSFEYQGKKYSEKSSYEDLRKLCNQIHKPGSERLPIDEYQALRGWLEDADRARWRGVLEKQIELAKERDLKKADWQSLPNNNRAPGGPGGPVACMFGPIAAVGRFAFGMVSLFDFSLGHNTMANRDRKREETIYQPDMHRQIPGGERT